MHGIYVVTVSSMIHMTAMGACAYACYLMYARRFDEYDMRCMLFDVCYAMNLCDSMHVCYVGYACYAWYDMRCMNAMRWMLCDV